MFYSFVASTFYDLLYICQKRVHFIGDNDIAIGYTSRINSTRKINCLEILLKMGK